MGEFQSVLTLPEAIRRAARTNRNRVAIRDENGQTRTYGAMLERANRISRACERRGLGRGDRIAILARNSPEFIECYLGIVQLGATVVPINFRLVAEEIAYVLEHSAAAAIIFDPEHAERIRQAVDGGRTKIRHMVAIGGPIGLAEGLEQAINAENDLSDLDPDRIDGEDPCAILYTAGTTGKPKGAIRSHRAVLWTSVLYAMALRVDSDSVYLATPPFFHIAGAECAAFPTLAQGGTVLTTRSFDVNRYLETIERERVTHCFAVPAMAIELVNSPAFMTSDLSSIRVWLSASAPFPEPLRRRVIERLPHATVINNIGSTECGPIASCVLSTAAPRYPNCVGKPWFGMQTSVIDDHGGELAPHTIGNLATSSPGLMSGYLDNPEATAEVMINGWCLTGDLASRDEDGLLYLADRKRDMINSGGEKIYAAEVESVLFELAGVSEAAVIGVPDPRWGESVVAVIVARPEAKLSEPAVIAHARKHLAPFKCPRRVVFVAELPRNTFGKVTKFALRERFVNLLDGGIQA